jgi:hypothetical protein
MLGTVFGILMMLFVGVVIAKQGSSSFFAQLMWADANDVLHMRWHPQ